jgi:hypothetical protein
MVVADFFEEREDAARWMRKFHREGQGMSVTAEYLLSGAALALEQCGLLLRDAVCLFKNRSFGSAVVLAAFAREELGRCQILI